MGLFEEAAKYIEAGKVKVRFGKNLVTVDVDDKIVVFMKKAGRTEISCSCQNHAMFCKSPVICKHKLAACTVTTMNKVKW